MKKDEGPVFSAYITKYALTVGILTKRAVQCLDTPTMIRVTGTAYPEYYHKPHWHCSPTEAEAEAAKMQVKAIRACEKKLAALKAMRIDAPQPHARDRDDERSD